MDSKKLVELALSLGNDERASRLAGKRSERTNRLIRDIRNKRFDKRDWERFDRMRSQSKPEILTKSTGVSIEDLIREAEELDAKGKLSERDLNRIQEIRNEVSDRLLGENVSIDDIIEESVESLKKPTRSKKAPDYRSVLPKHMQKMNPTSIIQQAEDQKFNRKMRDRRSLAREAARDDYNRLPSETRWDPIAQEETDLLSKYAKEDSLQRGRDKLKTQRDIINNYGDIAYKEGYNDPESRRILFGAMDELGSDYEDAIKMIKGDVSGLTGNPRFANDPMIREAFEDYLYEKGFPIDKIDQLNKETGGSIVSREALTDREKMLRLLEDIEAQTGIDKMFTTKLRDDASAVGGVIDEMPVELTGRSQIGRRQMNDDLKNKLVAYRTRKGATTGVDIDDVLLNPYLSTKDLSRSKRVSDYIKEETGRLRKEQNIQPSVEIKPLRDVHPGPKWKPNRDALIKKDRSELLEEAINDRYGSVDNLRKINSNVPEGAEHIVDEANSWLNAYDDAVDAERKFMDLEDNRYAESVADLLEDPAVLERKNQTPRSRDYGEETLRIRDEAKKTMEDELQFIAEAAERKGIQLSKTDREKVLWLIRNRDSDRTNRRSNSLVETLDKTLDEMIRSKSVDKTKDVKVTKTKHKVPIRKREQMIEEAVNKSRDKGALSVRKFTPSGKEIGRFKKRKKDLLKEMNPVAKKQKIDKDLGQSEMNTSKWNKPATREFITGVSKENGFRLSEQMIEQLLKMTKQQVIDYIDNISDPYIRPNKFVK